MNDCVSVFLTGVGGQGILLASEIISNAAMLSGFDVKTNEVHGMAQRGGTVTALVRYGPKVYSPLICEGNARVLCAFEMAEAIRAAHYLAPGGLAVVNQYRIIPVTVSSGSAVYPENIKETLRKRFPRLCYFDATQKPLKPEPRKRQMSSSWVPHRSAWTCGGDLARSHPQDRETQVSGGQLEGFCRRQSRRAILIGQPLKQLPHRRNAFPNFCSVKSCRSGAL
jgi:indolepyruvate ferredoxin oxidoreductase beta subunit